MAGKTTSTTTPKSAAAATAKKMAPAATPVAKPATPAAAPKAAPAPAAKAAEPAKPAAPAKTKAAPKSADPKVNPAPPATEFSLNAPDAKAVVVTGSFNDWNQEEHQAKRNKNGVWKVKVALPPGRYEYLFLVDGNWWTDPENPTTVWNSFGSANSVLEV